MHNTAKWTVRKWRNSDSQSSANACAYTRGNEYIVSETSHSNLCISCVEIHLWCILSCFFSLSFWGQYPTDAPHWPESSPTALSDTHSQRTTWGTKLGWFWLTKHFMTLGLIAPQTSLHPITHTVYRLCLQLGINGSHLYRTYALTDAYCHPACDSSSLPSRETIKVTSLI